VLLALVIVDGAVAPCAEPNVAAKNNGDGYVGLVVNSGVYHDAVEGPVTVNTVISVVAVNPSATYTKPFGATVDTFVITSGVPNVKFKNALAPIAVEPPSVPCATSAGPEPVPA
jgi:hypothetical protein